MKLLRYYGRLVRQSTYSFAKGLALPLMRRGAVKGGDHEMIYPVLTYSPWLNDPEFQAIYGAARKSTLVDIWRSYELWNLVDQVKKVDGAIVEVGVWRGGTGAMMARRAEQLGIKDTIYLCDTWEGVVKTGEHDPYYHDGKHDDTSREIVQKLVDEQGLTNVKLLKGVFPDETADQVSDKKLRLVHIDVDIYQSGADVLDWAWPKLSSGGVVVFDDFGCPGTPGITDLVNERRGEPDRFYFHNANGHAVFIKR